MAWVSYVLGLDQDLDQLAALEEGVPLGPVLEGGTHLRDGVRLRLDDTFTLPNK